ncbi:MAG TPA: hypothetical protein VFQ68_45685 [Streptosporangiaceae bacterium]|nr:hypothetical protein [Streptosporangiaceae bacterium]
MQASVGVCVATGDFPGSLCGGEIFRRIGGAGLCVGHYDRALYDRRAIFRQEDEDYGWSFDARRWDADAAEVVYYLLRESDGLIKIGTSTVLRQRLGDLRAEHGAIRLLLTHRGDRVSEHGMHVKFADFRVEGEWFRAVTPLMDWIVEVRERQAKITPPGLLPGTVALSEVLALAKAARRTRRAASRSVFERR